MYMVALTLVLVLLFAMSREKYMLFVNKDTELLKLKEDNIVANNYTLLFKTESVPLTYNMR